MTIKPLNIKKKFQAPRSLKSRRYFPSNQKKPETPNRSKDNKKSLIQNKLKRYYDYSVGPRMFNFYRFILRHPVLGYRREGNDYIKDDANHINTFKRFARIFPLYYLTIRQTQNNVFITVTRGYRKGKVRLDKYWWSSIPLKSYNKLMLTASCGSVGFGGPRRATKYAAQILGREVATKLKKKRIEQVSLLLRYPLSWRMKATLKALSKAGLGFRRIICRFAISHNGIRKRKQRRK